MSTSGYTKACKKRYTPEQFADGLKTMRPGLIKYACRMRPCHAEDAEDLVGEAVRLALQNLAEFDNERSSLVTWMNSNLRIVILRDRAKHLSEPSTVPLIHALPLESAPNARLRSAVRPHLDRLPLHLREAVNWHLDGYTQQEIADGLGVSINTVANRITLAGQQLKCVFVDFEDAWDRTEFDYCAKQGSRYVRQNSMGKYWRNHHPSQKAWERVRSAGAFGTS